jgi:hypothetical protein
MFYKCNSVIKINRFLWKFIIQWNCFDSTILRERTGGVFLFFLQPQTEFPAVTLLFHRPYKIRFYKDLQVNLQKRFGLILSFNFGFPVNQKQLKFRYWYFFSFFSFLYLTVVPISAAKSPKSVASSVASSSSCVSLSYFFPQLRHYEIFAVFLRSQFQS